MIFTIQSNGACLLGEVTGISNQHEQMLPDAYKVFNFNVKIALSVSDDNLLAFQLIFVLAHDLAVSFEFVL